jgi:hypothetical protein
VELAAVLEEHPEVNVDEYKHRYGWWALWHACCAGHTECARVLIDHGADVHAQRENDEYILHTAALRGNLGCAKLLVQHGADVNCLDSEGCTPLINSAYNAHLPVAQYLLELKADVHYRVAEGYQKGEDVLYMAMVGNENDGTPGNTFAFLACNTDVKNLEHDAEDRDAHIEEYTRVQAYVDEYHSILILVLSEHVPVDPRFGLGQMGIYHEPLERTLEDLGMSMTKDQEVNTPIEGEEVKRALIPGHLLNANHWFDLNRKEKLRAQLQAQIDALFP